MQETDTPPVQEKKSRVIKHFLCGLLCGLLCGVIIAVAIINTVSPDDIVEVPPVSDYVVCDVCEGEKEVPGNWITKLFGPYTCGNCEGRGEIQANRCTGCSGSGRVWAWAYTFPVTVNRIPMACPNCNGTGQSR